jgi:lysozyme
MVEIPGAPGPVAQSKRRRNKLGCGIVIAPLLALAGFAALSAKSWHPSDSAYHLQGIDVSHHQGPIEWRLLPDQGVDFAYIKATEGGDFVDPAFARNWREAQRAGIRRGAYHFFTLCRSGADQAANFIATVPAHRDALPPVVDLEYMGNCSERPPIADVQAELAAFLLLVERHYGQRAVLYLTEEFDSAHAISARFRNPLWLRSLIFEPDFGARPWSIWQASNFRRLDGIDGRVDWNVMRPEVD